MWLSYLQVVTFLGVVPKESLGATSGICCPALTVSLIYGTGAAQLSRVACPACDVLDVSWPCSYRCH